MLCRLFEYDPATWEGAGEGMGTSSGRSVIIPAQAYDDQQGKV